MHEMAITQSMLDLVLEEAAKAGAGKVLTVNVVIGEMTGVVDDCLRTYFDLLSPGTPAEGAVLSVQNVPRQARCRDCAHVFHPSGIDWRCPQCRSFKLEIIAGNELHVESMEVE